MKAKILYEKTMKDLICPSNFKKYSPESIRWVELQLDKGYITDKTMYHTLVGMLVSIRKEVAQDIPKGIVKKC